MRRGTKGADSARNRLAFATVRRRSAAIRSSVDAGLSRAVQAEALEARVLLSGYALSHVTSFVPAPNGYQPGGLGIDSAGNLFGTTNSGGTYNAGVIYEIPKGTTTLTTLASFNSNGLAQNVSGLLIDANDDLFGTTTAGGASNNGTVFELVHGSSTITTIASFDVTNANPFGGVVMDSKGDLFGRTEFGGAVGDGIVYEIMAGSSTVTPLGSFSEPDSYNTTDDSVYVGLTIDPSGNLFGVTETGGPSNDGTVFEVVSGTSTISTIASFNGTNGLNPVGSVVIDRQGDVFGETLGVAGAYSSSGSVFEVVNGSATITTLVANVDYPAGLVIDASGNLYGTTRATPQIHGGGSVFEIASGGTTLTTLALLPAHSGYPGDQDNPTDGFVIDGNGNLFGTTTIYNISTPDTVDGQTFELAHGSTTPAFLASFYLADGEQPTGTLAFDPSGNLYGVTEYGGLAAYNDDGAAGFGTIFELPVGAMQIETLTDGPGANPTNLVIDPSGNIYGTAFLGYTANLASYFEIPHGTTAATEFGSQYSVLGSVVDGQNALIVDSSGNVYGSLFKIAAGTTTITQFTATASDTSSRPWAPFLTGTPALDSSGDLFGVSDAGGPSGDGVVYEVAAGTTTATLLTSFDGTNGSAPISGLTADANGDLFGTTTSGGANNDGTVFEIAAGTSTITTLASFNGTNGSDSIGNVVLDSNGDIFGTTNTGGSNNDGTVFEIPAGTNTITTLVTFDGANGANPPFGGLIMNSAGDLFGTTYAGGTANDGTLYELTPTVAPSITTQPANQTVTVGQAVTLTAGAGGKPTPTVQWQISSDGGMTFSNIPGATSTIYSFTASAEQSGNEYQAVFTNSLGSATTSPATVTVNSVSVSAAPVVTASPTSQSVFAGNTVIFTASASGTPTPTVHWQVSTNGGGSFSNISGATSPSYSFAATAGQNSNEYRAVFTNTGGSATTSAATLTVTTPTTSVAPVVTNSPASQGVASGSAVTFSAAASGSPSPTVQWQISTDGGISFTNISGATSTTYSFTASASQNNDEYQAVFSNSQGSATSSVATLQILSLGATPPLAPTLGKVVLPAAVVAGSKLNGRLTLYIANTGPAFNGKTTINLYADETTGLDGNQVLLKSLTERIILKSGKTLAIPFAISTQLSSTLAAGPYYVLAQVTDPSGNTSMVATTQTVAVAAPFVQPVVTVGAVTPSTIVLNKFGSVSVTVTNNGNVTASGITLTLSPSTDGISPIDGDVLDTVTLKGVRIPAGRKQVFRLRFKVTSAVASGAFFPYMSVSLNGVLATAVGAGQFTVAGTGV